jgi:glycosyltransferase involved in cell wall biosynthesis
VLGNRRARAHTALAYVTLLATLLTIRRFYKFIRARILGEFLDMVCGAEDNLAGRTLRDRFLIEGKGGIDVLLTTLDAESCLEQSLFSLYAEVPVARLLVCDGGSKDRTLEILSRFPRVEVFQPNNKTHGKDIEFVISKAETDWVMFHESDHTYAPGWFDEMLKYRDRFDAIDSQRIHVYTFTRPDSGFRGLSPQLGKLEAIRNFRVEDDCLTRIVDIALRQEIVKNGFRYGVANTTRHFHHVVEEVRYPSHLTKRATKVVFREPEEVIIDESNWKRRLTEVAKGYVKYIDCDTVIEDKEIDQYLMPLLNKHWVLANARPGWVQRYRRARSIRFRLMFHMRRMIWGLRLKVKRPRV